MAATDPAAMKAVAGKLTDAESAIALKDLFNRLGAGNLAAEGVEGVSADARSSYLFNSNIVGVEDADLVLLVGSDPRVEAPVLNARLRRACVAGGTAVASVGPHGDLTYPVEALGGSARTIEEICGGKHPFAAKLKAAERPLIIVGASLLRRPDREGLMKQLHALADASGVVTADWNGFNVLHDAGGTVAALDIGFVPSTSAAANPTAPELVYSLGAEDFDAPEGAFVVYQGHHGDRGAAAADVVLPGAAYTEKPATYVNTEGRAQRAMPALAPHGRAREDWKIVRALSEVCGAALPYDDLAGVRARLAEVAPHFARVDDVEPALWLNGAAYAHVPAKSAKADDACEARVQRHELLHDGRHLEGERDDGQGDQGEGGERVKGRGGRRAREAEARCNDHCAKKIYSSARPSATSARRVDRRTVPRTRSLITCS
jgi:NADH dehydrogenase (ubiquinone) Fe-S protein 1